MASVETEQLVFDVSANVTRAREEFQNLAEDLDKVIVMLYGVFSLMRRMGLEDDAAKAIAELQRLISTLMMLHRALVLVQTSTPLGAALGLLGVIGGGLTLTDQLRSFM